jgi:hypothetical protein
MALSQKGTKEKHRKNIKKVLVDTKIIKKEYRETSSALNVSISKINVNIVNIVNTFNWHRPPSPPFAPQHLSLLFQTLKLSNSQLFSFIIKLSGQRKKAKIV